MGVMISHVFLIIKAFEMATGNPVSAVTDKHYQNYGSLKNSFEFDKTRLRSRTRQSQIVYKLVYNYSIILLKFTLLVKTK